MRKVQFLTGEYYHIYNRGVDKREIFVDDKDFVRFIRGMREFNVVKPIGSLSDKSNLVSKRGSTPSVGGEPLQPPFIDIVCYCFNAK